MQRDRLPCGVRRSNALTLLSEVRHRSSGPSRWSRGLVSHNKKAAPLIEKTTARTRQRGWRNLQHIKIRSYCYALCFRHIASALALCCRHIAREFVYFVMHYALGTLLYSTLALCCRHIAKECVQKLLIQKGVDIKSLGVAKYRKPRV